MRRVVSLFLPIWPTDRLRRQKGSNAPAPDEPLAIARRFGIGRASVYRLLGKQAVGEANGGAGADQG